MPGRVPLLRKIGESVISRQYEVRSSIPSELYGPTGHDGLSGTSRTRSERRDPFDTRTIPKGVGRCSMTVAEEVPDT